MAVILGSAFQDSIPRALELEKIEIQTEWGNQTLFQAKNCRRPAYLLFRHGLPHQMLPNQVNYRAQTRALKQMDCGALMVTSSVGVLDPDLPLFKPMLLTDLLMLENRLPDGSAHSHLLLAGIAQAAAGAKKLKSLDRLLKETSTTQVRKEATMASHLPPSFPEIADALERSRDVFEAADVFPSRWIDLTLGFLRS